MLSERGRRVKRTEIGLGIAAGAAGIVLGLTSLLGWLPYAAGTPVPHDAQTTGLYSIVLLAANAFGVVAALAVNRRHVLGALGMSAVTAVVLVFGFPWQSLPAVLYIMSVVMALVPEKSLH